jgi:transcriptional regulator with XRE-family HTH domain
MQGEAHSKLPATLQHLRAERDWSRATLARRARLGINTVVRIETAQTNPKTGKVDVPKPSTLRKLAEALGDGSAERTREALGDLYAAAGYAPEDVLDEPDLAQAVAELRARVDEHDRQLQAFARQVAVPPKLPDQIARIIGSLPPEQQAEAIDLITATLQRFAQGA